MRKTAFRLILWICLWFVVIAIAATLDARVAMLARDSGAESFLLHHKLLKEILKAPGFYPFTLIVIIPLVIWLHPLKWRAGWFTFLGTLLSGSNQIIKWIVGRTRPFRPMDGSHRLVPFELHPFPAFGTKNLCFPSGHACLAFATAASLAILLPRFRWLFYSLATIVAIERFCENAHWLSDTVAAAALGIGGVYLIRWMMKFDDRRAALPLTCDPCL